MPDKHELEARERELVDRSGPWVFHNIHLTHGIYTISPEVNGNEQRLSRILQLASDLFDGDLEGKRVLDLGSMEGLFAIEFARRGARVLGIEGRHSHVEKARFAKDVLELDNLEIIHDDVRNISRGEHGEFDLVLCLGILYHLDTPDVFSFVDRVAELCQRVAIVDTHYSIGPKVERSHGSEAYWGRLVWEHDEGADENERDSAYAASLNNPESFWLTRPSLLNLLARAGFTSVTEAPVPRVENDDSDRVTLIASRGKCLRPLSAPQVVNDDYASWPERERFRLNSRQGLRGRARRLARPLPAPIRRALIRGRRMLLR